MAEINKEQQEIAQQIGKLSAESASYTKLKASYDKHTKTMETLEQALEAYKTVKAPPKAGQEAIRKEIKDKRDVLREVESSIGIAEKDITFMRRVLDALAKPVCPISSKLVCSTDKTGIRSELEAGVKEKQKIVSQRQMKKGALDKEVDDLERKREAIAKQEKDYQAKLLYLEQLSPKGGVRQKVLEYHIRPLQDYCNGKMGDLLPGYDMVTDTSDGFQVLFADKSGGGMISYKSLSKGEQLRSAYVLMSM
ncbi:hypothetical protein [Clostridium sp. AM58-1XD]|uniref:hypothetical protein n=1 Tax=Clostridium sp. AM58-1XD TaxID=2292307 RepID=UPI000E491424|nr:hypothetical protein [Clostridium sp. AM58-1XD]RGZ01617.1 hypothetical protein DXA13_01945 [Clostridium sp. AM58-1XD]